MNKVIVGVDPGLSGAVALLDCEKGNLFTFDMPTEEVIVNKKKKREIDGDTLHHLMKVNPLRVYIEMVTAMPGQGVTSMFNFGMAFGVLRGVVASLGYARSFIRPSKWKKDMGVTSDKDTSLDLMRKLAPACEGFFKRKKDNGRAEAALIALWGARDSGIVVPDALTPVEHQHFRLEK